MSTIKPKRGNGAPSGLSQYEFAVDSQNRFLYIGNVGGTGDVIGSHATINGLSGAIGISAGSNITISQSGNTLTISSVGNTGATGAGFSFTGNTYNIPFIYDGGLSADSHFFVDIYGGLHSDRLHVHGDYVNAAGFPLEMYVGSLEVDQFLVQHNISGLGSKPAINLYGYSLTGTTATVMDLSSNQIRLTPNGINDPVKPSTVTVFNNSVDYSTYDSYVKVKSPTVILGDEELDWDGIYIRIDQGEARTAIHGNVGIEAGTLTAEDIYAEDIFAQTVEVSGASGAFIFPNGQTASSIVTSINGASGAVGLTAGSNITITQSGLTFTISSSGGGGGGSGFTYASSAPSSPAIGDRWIDSDTGKEYVYVNDGTSSQWIEPVSSNGLDGLTYTGASKLYEFGGTGSFVKLGIGITAPQYTLHVVGDSNFTSGISAASIRLSGGINGVTASFTGSVSSDAGYQITSGAINAQTGTTYSLLSNDNGKIITMNNGSSTTVTIPSGLPIGYNTTVIQLGAGQVGFTGSGTTINSAEGKLNIANRYSAANIISYTTNTFILAGGLTG